MSYVSMGGRGGASSAATPPTRAVRSLVVVGIGFSAWLAAASVNAANGQCRWEGGPGAAGGHAYCRAEDCIGQGGNAQCTKPVGAPAIPFTDAQVGPDKWAFHMCDEAPPHASAWANWCISAGGQWHGNNGNPYCDSLPPDIIGGGGSTTNNEGRAVSISDTFVQRKYSSCSTTLQSDTGWGASLTSNLCWGGGTVEQAGIPVWELRRRTYNVCSGSIFMITMLRNRSVKCPVGYKSRTSGGQLQCYKPIDAVCPVGNPVAPMSGVKLQTEVDYRSSADIGIELTRHYNSAGYYRPAIVSTLGFAPAGQRLPSDYWRHNYDRRIYSVTGSAEVMAIVQRHDGSMRSFDTSGNELDNRDGGAENLQAISGGWKLTRADRSIETYDSTGRLQSITAATGEITSLSYGTNGLLSTVTGPFGHTLQFAYDSDGNVTSITTPGNTSVIYGYDGQRRLNGVTYPDSTTRQYHYEDANDAWLLTGITDESNNRYATYTYDSSGRVIVSQHADGADRHEFGYGTNTTTLTDPAGTPRTLSYTNANGVFRAASSSAPGVGCGITKVSTFDAQGNLATRTDFNNNQTRYSYDSARNLETSRTEAYGTPRARTITTQWHPQFRLPSQIDEPGRRASFGYDSNGLLLTRTVTDLSTNQARTVTYTRNSFGQTLTIDGPRSDVTDVTTYTYAECTYGAECGQPMTVTNAAGHTTSFMSYNAHGQPLTINDSNNVLTTLAYDARQRLISRDVAGEVTTFSYHPTGQLRRVTRMDGSYLEYGYDAAHRLIRIEDNEGNRISYTLDASGQRTAENVYDPTNTLARTRSRVYDALSRLSQELDSSSSAITYTYDINGNRESVVDAQGRLTTYGYDELNRQISTVDPMNGYTETGYSARDELQSVIDPRSLTTTYQYNGFGDLTAVSSPDTNHTTYTRDAAGNLQQSTDARNRTATYSYDALNRVTQIAYSDQIIQYTYDQGTHGSGKLTQLSDASGATHWTYTAQGRVATKQHVVGATTLTVAYSYNTSGQLNQVTTPSGQVIALSYVGGKVSSISVNGSPLLHSILYAPFGPTRGWNWANGTLAVREYDLDGRLTTVDSAGMSSYAFYADGAISSLSEDSAAPLNGSEGLTTFEIDENSNRIESSDGLDARTYSYDASGNVIGDGVHSFTYNSAGRMVSAGRSGMAASYALNGLGQRVRKTVNGQARLFAYDEAGHLIGEYTANGALIQEIVWFGDIPVAVLRPNSGPVAVYYIHSDHLDTPRRITRPSDNALVWRWSSDPFGSTAAQEDPDGDSSAFVFPLRFPGQYFDPETGLHYNFMRNFDPRTGRYIESDPIGLRGGLNTYAYAGGNPVGMMDPLGLAYFAKRPLSDSPWLGWASCNFFDNFFNTEVSHEQLFFEDGKSPSNIGFFDDGTLKEEPNPQGYRCRSGKYDDCIMRKAVANVPLRPYCLLGKPGIPKFNCQDWATEVRKEYRRLANDPKVKQECECKK